MCALLVAQSALLAADDRRSPIVSSNTNPALRAPVTLNAREASLSEVLRLLSERSDMNFVVGEGVQRERITIMLNNTPLEEAINLIVRASGLSYEIIGNSILIAEPDKLKEDVGLSAYVVELKYAKAEEVAPALANLTTNITVDKGGNRLIIYASPRVIMEIERIVNAIDKPHILVLLETRLIEISMSKLDQYGIRWDMLGGGPGDPVGTVLNVPSQTLSDGLKFDGRSGRGQIMHSGVNISAAISLMVQNGDGRVLMDSKLTTTNNREATLHIGEIVPYVIQTYTIGGAGGGESQQIEKENVGVLLSMTPHINDENQITLTLSPEVSNIVEWRGSIPVVRTRKTNTTVRVEDGQTVILAGLLSEEQTTTTYRVPVLGSIPVLGLLFQHKRNDSRKTNLIIEVVPRIINDPAEISKYMTMRMGATAPTREERRGRRGRGGSRGQQSQLMIPQQQPNQPAMASPAVRPATAHELELAGRLED
jgi:type II secretory pathway component GspD/PulD (secretin)